MSDGAGQLRRDCDEKSHDILVKLFPGVALQHQDTKVLSMMNDGHAQKSVENLLTGLRGEIPPNCLNCV